MRFFLSITFDCFAVLLCETSHFLWLLSLNFAMLLEDARSERNGMYDIDAEESALSSLKITLH